ncbi:uncharacterized protein LOC124414235 [Diprion similis]|uniref:uncharacterized protein LOC124414235 n=1 Tax=Diprion similis TaxID=362088 RepID=UPI001EF85AEB|nr:uncharacterized protein LOC124414235 [Diprion similis]XP_046751169.1 uncharacterized protein LOC124414235 [Diprion similis]XP_046751170.1 uncharacterized protein LOC124414235 [Diprion similis]XP_046751171.1 uncharacterized protein LOC124414235 [Diprion similis]XP_046751172.1 uncharacterized protein LOC124414235 [Diprion similis]
MRYCWFKVAFSALSGLSLYFCNAAPIGSTLPEAKDTAYSHPARTLDTDQGLGQPIDMAWEAWIVTDKKLSEDGSNFEASTAPRRITSKSVFLPPSVNKTCDDGYRLESNMTCVPITISFNPHSHFENFILSRLRNRTFANSTSVTKLTMYGPVQVGLPLSIEDKRPPPSSSEKPERDEDSVEIAVVHPIQEDKKSEIDMEAGLTVYLLGNGTTKSANSSGAFEDQGTGGEPSIADFVEDGSQDFTEMINYRIPIDLGHLLNGSKLSENSESYESGKNVTTNETQTFVLLLAPAVVTTLTSEEPTTTLSNDESFLRNHKNGTVNSTDSHGVPVKIDGPDSPSVGTVEEEATTQSEFTTAKEEEEEVVEEEKEATTSGDDATESSTISFEDEESLIWTTLDPEDQEELLTHSEAGMLVSPGNLRPLISDPIKQEPPMNEEEEVSQISSESSIRGDMIMETTLLGLHATPKKPDALSELFESNPEVVFSPQDDRRPDRASTKESKDDSSTVPQGSLLANDAEVIPTLRRTISSANQGRVRFPEDPTNPSSSYVLFPGDNNSNSVNENLAYKKRRERISSPFEDATTGVTSDQLDQRNTQWIGLPAGHETGSSRRSPPQTGSPGSQRQTPMLFRFWKRMPLIRDPAMIHRSRGPSSDISQIRGLPPPPSSSSIYRDVLPRAYPGQRVFNRNFRGTGSPSTVQRIG